MAQQFKIGKLPVVYRGSVKNLRLRKPPTAAKSGRYIFEYTDAYSVFDYGRMPDTLPGKGAAMAVGSAYFFEQLENPDSWQKLVRSKAWQGIKDADFRGRLLKSPALKALKKDGLKTHYRGLIDQNGNLVRTDKLTAPSSLMEVESVPILHPEPLKLGGKTIWNYNGIQPNLTNFLVPLECVFRFGIPQGSSLMERLGAIPDYHKELGLKQKPKAGCWLPMPIVELFSKLEPGDRFLRPETALNFSGLTTEEFRRLYDMTYLIAIFLLDHFSTGGIKLWDGKFEFLKSGELKLGDAITPDELRLTYKNIQISKEPLRQYYKRNDPKFVNGMKQAKDISAKTGQNLKTILTKKLGITPKRLDGDFLKAAAGMYTSLTGKVTGLPIFEDSLDLAKVISVFKKYKVA